MEVIRSGNCDELLKEWLESLESNVNGFVSDFASFSFKDQHQHQHQHQHLDAYMDCLRDELTKTQAETAALSNQIQTLKYSCLQGTCQLETNIESWRHAVHYANLEGQGQALTHPNVDNVKSREDQQEGKTHYDDCFEVLELKHQVEMNNATLKSLQDLDLNLKRIEVMESIEEALTGLKVIYIEGNIIRVSLRTYIPEVDDMKNFEVNHELSLEVMDGTMELKNVEIFPNDVYIADIIEAANTFRTVFSVSAPQTRSPLGWFLQKVQDRIVMCTIRQFMVKIANKARPPLFEYLDKDELIVAHIGGIDALIRPSQGWPLSTFPLELVSIRSSDDYAFEISSSLVSKVEEANSFDLNVRKSITNFVGAIVEILPDKIRADICL